MAQTGKQEVAVTSKAPEKQKSGTPTLPEPYEPFEHFMDSMFRRDWLRPLLWREPMFELLEQSERRLSVDVVDKEDSIVVRAEMPGVDKKDVSVSLSDHLLTIKGSFHREEKEEKPQYYRRELSRGSFERGILLPENIDASKVDASLANGMLEVTVAKAKESKRRSIEVK